MHGAWRVKLLKLYEIRKQQVYRKVTFLPVQITISDIIKILIN